MVYDMIKFMFSASRNPSRIFCGKYFSVMVFECYSLSFNNNGYCCVKKIETGDFPYKLNYSKWRMAW